MHLPPICKPILLPGIVIGIVTSASHCIGQDGAAAVESRIPRELAQFLEARDDPQFNEAVQANLFIDSVYGTRGNRLVVILAGPIAAEKELFRRPIRATLSINGDEVGTWSGVLHRGGHPIVRGRERRGEVTLESDIMLSKPLLNQLLQIRKDPELVATMQIQTDVPAIANSTDFLIQQRIRERIRRAIDRDRMRLEEIDENDEATERRRQELRDRIEGLEERFETLVLPYWAGTAEAVVELGGLKAS